MTPIKILFFGSTTDSVIVLSHINEFHFTNYDVRVVAVVTQPPRPVGRDKRIMPTPVEVWAKKHGVTSLNFPTSADRPWEYENEQTVIDTLQPLKADLVVSASYGQKIPAATLKNAKFGGLNVHPSILPRWRGGDPVPWAILSGDHQIGVTVVTLSSTFDQGKIISQKKLPISPDDTSNPLRTKLFSMGAKLLTDSLPDYLSGKNKGAAQKTEGQPYAKRFSRQDGFEPWEKVLNPEEAERLERKFRALDPWPGLWTTFNGKRLKILSCHLTHDTHLALDTVQLEGKKPVSWEQFKSSYVPWA